ncbi:MAG TPA: glycoside hydrolase family 3 N-terminal domain-containing protein, partial [Thermoanaerobaculia bacterium]|nr:glycoside hydrolase family 3 N-terminal domain-containing protein [Thermoanaerobaculia bacterium]
GFPSAEAIGESDRAAEMSAWLGRAIGMALRFFDIECDLAPVVDVRGEVPTKGLERRAFGRDPETVIELAGAFMRGLHASGVAACLKHFPGIGSGSADPHYGATVIDVPLEQLLARDLVPFERLGAEARAIMIGHGTHPQLDDPDLPASLSRKLTTELLRDRIGFDGIAISDDMEMHAVSDLGTYEAIAERALLAGNDAILFCSHIERVPDLDRYLRKRIDEDATVRARFEEAVARCDAYRAHCERIRSAAQPVATFAELLAEVDRFCDAFQETRASHENTAPEVERRQSERKGRSGREEWT